MGQQWLHFKPDMVAVRQQASESFKGCRHIPAECTAKPCHCPSNEERDCQQSLLLLPSQASFPYSFSFHLPLTPHGIPIPRRPFLPFTLTSQINQMPSEVPSNALIFALLNFGPITNKPATSMVLLGVLKWAKLHSQHGCFP